MNFNEMQKIPRLSRECVITEKIDGTNGSVYIELREAFKSLIPSDEFRSANCLTEWLQQHPAFFEYTHTDGTEFIMAGGQRTQWTDPKGGNAGFGKWVYNNRVELFKLGPGHHFGEWWGGKVQRGYGLKEKRFSLFNTSRWSEETRPSCCHVVPVLYRGLFSTQAVEDALQSLREKGSFAAPGFMKPEGVVIFHVAGNLFFKKTLEKDEVPKGIKES